MTAVAAITASLPALTYLPGAWLDLHVAPPPRWPIPLRNTRAVHGLVTTLIAESHSPLRPLFSLAPWPEGVGWAVYVLDLDHALRCAGRTTQGELFRKPTLIRCSGARRVPAPAVPAGPRIVEVRTVTPICLRSSDGTGAKVYRTELRESHLLSTLQAWLTNVVGIAQPGPLDLRIVMLDTRAEVVPMGGKLGAVTGIAGRFVVEVSSWALWALRVAEVMGLGGRVAYGFGRIVIRG